MAPIPLCVDLDGTLVNTDVSWESFTALCRHRPLALFLVPFWLCQGLPRLKKRIAERVDINATLLPYNQPFLNFLRAQKAEGRQLVLATASDVKWARAISDHLKLFDQTVATDGGKNLAGLHKGRALTALFGHRSFDYAGNSAQDLAVWAMSRRAILVNTASSVERRGRARFKIEKSFPRAPADWFVRLRFLGAAGWLPNLIIFAPVVWTRQVEDFHVAMPALLTVAAFSMVSSALSAFGTLMNIEKDRLRFDNNANPLAAGHLSVTTAFAMSLFLLATGFGISALLSFSVSGLLALYFALNIALVSKSAFWRVLIVAASRTLLVMAGRLVAGSAFSLRVTAFVLFFFVSLALFEWLGGREGPSSNLPNGWRLYAQNVGKKNYAEIAAFASAVLSTLILAFTITRPDTTSLYRSPNFLWGLCVLELFWSTRVGWLVRRGRLKGDPITFAFRDPVSYAIAAAGGIIVALAGRAAGS